MSTSVVLGVILIEMYFSSSCGAGEWTALAMLSFATRLYHTSPGLFWPLILKKDLNKFPRLPLNFTKWRHWTCSLPALPSIGAAALKAYTLRPKLTDQEDHFSLRFINDKGFKTWCYRTPPPNKTHANSWQERHIFGLSQGYLWHWCEGFTSQSEVQELAEKSPVADSPVYSEEIVRHSLYCKWHGFPVPESSCHNEECSFTPVGL